MVHFLNLKSVCTVIWLWLRSVGHFSSCLSLLVYWPHLSLVPWGLYRVFRNFFYQPLGWVVSRVSGIIGAMIGDCLSYWFLIKTFNWRLSLNHCLRWNGSMLKWRFIFKWWSLLNMLFIFKFGFDGWWSWLLRVWPRNWSFNYYSLNLGCDNLWIDRKVSLLMRHNGLSRGPTLKLSWGSTL